MFISTLCLNFSLAAVVIQAAENQSSTFEDLGHMLFYGIAIAIAAALGIAYLMIKIGNSRDSSTAFTSINPSQHDKPRR
jgi:membrane protein DedA with SNARE-associated domain